MCDIKKYTLTESFINGLRQRKMCDLQVRVMERNKAAACLVYHRWNPHNESIKKGNNVTKIIECIYMHDRKYVCSSFPFSFFELSFLITAQSGDCYSNYTKLLKFNPLCIVTFNIYFNSYFQNNLLIKIKLFVRSIYHVFIPIRLFLIPINQFFSFTCKWIW